MDVVVCVKQVPDTTEVRIDPETNTLVRAGVASIVNPFDMYAVEEAVRLVEHYGGTSTAITMGPPQAEAALRETLAMGVNRAVLLSDPAFAGSDTLATSLVLSRAIRRLGSYDMVICGKQASDGDTSQVGPGIAAYLNLPQATYVRKIDFVDLEGRPAVARVERLLEEGYEVVDLELPALITVVKEINEPRIPSLRGRMTARKAEIPRWSRVDLGIEETEAGLKGSPTRVVSVFAPPARKHGVVWNGDSESAARRLVETLRVLP